MNIKSALEAAEVFDSWRIVPRIIIAVYLALFVWVVIVFTRFYFGLTPTQRTVEVTAFASVVLTAMTGAFPYIVKIYMDNGRDWNAKLQSQPQQSV